MLEVATALGKRYERLLFLTAPISLLAILVAFVTTASVRQREHFEAGCLTAAARAFSDGLTRLEPLWTAGTTLDDKLKLIKYRSELSYIWIDGSDLSPCYKPISDRLDELATKPPEQIISELTKRASELRKTPLSAFGFTVPVHAEIDLLVARATVDLVTLTKVLQIVLLPVLLLWLGSLYGTRYREALATADAKSIAEVFPHIINSYPIANLSTPRKREFLVAYTKHIAWGWYGMTRTSLVLVFIGPPVAAYLYSVLLGFPDNFGWSQGIAAFFVSMFFLANIIAEWEGPHLKKIFNDPAADPKYFA